jgi:hypothetical protein
MLAASGADQGDPMKNKLGLMAFGGLVLSVVSLGVPLYAHHGFEFEYDASKYVTVTGVLTKVDWENPHIYFNVDATDADGKVNSWRFEGSSVAIVQRTGTTRADLVNNIGKTVTVGAVPGKGKTSLSRGAAEKVKLADGREIVVARQRYYGEGSAAGDKDAK